MPTASDLPPDRLGFFLAVPLARRSKQGVNSGLGGALGIQVGTGTIPVGPPVAFQPGEIVNFRAWYRNSSPYCTSNL